ncbi:EamA/RhaT family transporter [Streptomyces sp. DG2A-72]|uniref:EamA/RhaT family transporter n=1 Tax=Streptomyces sp. DG2A-72 TaxID=3051386 RepID=UPI00265C44CE|nr:EamA/RhaT family transporter [Streptomyces sp. DG2A-72]MDO0935351.1 EamA/RhaT family transporter [Streptomyces sp. DG2A-72]
MSDDSGTPATPAGSNGTPDTPAPRPEPIRFFGTTWVNHDKGYTTRRIAAAAGSLATTVAACLVLRFAYEGLQIAGTGSFVNLLVVAMFAVCTALAFRHTWDAFGKRPDPDRQSSLRGLLAIGFVGSLLAYFIRSLVEAPGERLHRKEYAAARERHEKRTTRRSGNPSKKKRRGKG